jgi:hypothetical protein
VARGLLQAADEKRVVAGVTGAKWIARDRGMFPPPEANAAPPPPETGVVTAAPVLRCYPLAEIARIDWASILTTFPQWRLQ